jgi:hypothetical protein
MMGEIAGAATVALGWNTWLSEVAYEIFAYKEALFAMWFLEF